MFQLEECFYSSGVFNDALIKRFKESYDPQNGSRVWMIPGHVIYTTANQKVYTCDARPQDLLSPSEPSTGELFSSSASVLEIFFETETQSLRMCIALSNGDVQIFEYRALLYEWARVGYFNLNITSPNNTNHQSHIIEKVFISSHQNIIYWAEKVGNGDTNLLIQKRTLPLNSVREITQSAIGPPQGLLKNCSKFEIFEVADNVFIIPELPFPVNLYFIISARSHLWVFDVCGKCLWRGVINNEPKSFFYLCTAVVGLWSHTGKTAVCRSLYHHRKSLYLFNNNVLLSLMPNGEITEKTEFELELEESYDIYILWNILCIFSNDVLRIYSLSNGKLLDTISLQRYKPIRGIWYHAATLPCLGFYSDISIFSLQPLSLPSVLSSKDSCYSQVINILSEGNVLLYSLMRDLVYNKIKESDLIPLKDIPDVLQSPALLLALIHLCRSKGICCRNFPFIAENTKKLFDLSSEIPYPETKLYKVLEPLVECYCKIEQAKQRL